MNTRVRILATAVSLALLATGPLAPLAVAQQPTPPPAQQPTPQPADPMQDKADRRASETAVYNVGAGIANVFYIPGKGALCFLGGAAGVFVMIVSVGSAPKTAAYFAREGCGGRWYLTGDDLRPDAEVRAFEWEKDAR